MKFLDFFRMGLVNLSRRKARTILTALSMAIGVMCIVVLISVGLGYEAAYRENIEAMGSLTKIDVTPPSDSTGGRTALLNDKAVDAFKSLNGVEAVTPVVQATAWLQSGSYVGSAKLYGIDLSTASSFLIYPVEGEMPGAGTHLRPEIMFTDDMAASFADPDKDWEFALNADGTPKVDLLHSTIKLTFDYANLSGEYQEGEDGRAVSAGNMYRLKISGLCSAQNYTYATSGFLDKTRLEEWISANSAFIPQRSLEDTGGQKTYDLVWVKAAEGDDVQAIAKVIRDAGFNTYSLNDMLESVKKQSNQIQGMLAAIGAVSMLVSAICIANTMMMSINERRKEIGVLKVLGSEMTDIMFMFMVEALLVGIAGGLFGMGLSFGMRELIPVLFSDMDVRSIIPVWLVVVGLGFSGIVALLSALAPAIGAMRISPLEAIRAE